MKNKIILLIVGLVFVLILTLISSCLLTGCGQSPAGENTGQSKDRVCMITKATVTIR